MHFGSESPVLGRRPRSDPQLCQVISEPRGGGGAPHKRVKWAGATARGRWSSGSGQNLDLGLSWDHPRVILEHRAGCGPKWTRSPAAGRPGPPRGGTAAALGGLPGPGGESGLESGRRWGAERGSARCMRGPPKCTRGFGPRERCQGCSGAAPSASSSPCSSPSPEEPRARCIAPWRRAKAQGTAGRCKPTGSPAGPAPRPPPRRSPRGPGRRRTPPPPESLGLAPAPGRARMRGDRMGWDGMGIRAPPERPARLSAPSGARERGGGTSAGSDGPGAAESGRPRRPRRAELPGPRRGVGAEARGAGAPRRSPGAPTPITRARGSTSGFRAGSHEQFRPGQARRARGHAPRLADWASRERRAS